MNATQAEIAELKACPFCGKTDKLTLGNITEPDDWNVECERCHIGQHSIYTKEQAIAHWNKRVESIPPKNEIVEGMVNRFLRWKLPKSVCVDLCATKNNYPFERLGTSLLTSDEARQLIEYLLPGDSNV